MSTPPPPPPSTYKVAKAAADAEWARRTDAWEAMAKEGGMQLPPGAKVDPKDVRVEIGPPMTEEQFKEWRSRRAQTMKKFSQQ
jgi:hypothetical protein